MDAKLVNTRTRYKRTFERTARDTPQFYPGQHVFVNIPPGQMTESTRMENALITDLLSKTLRPFKVISATVYTITVDENGF